jgi:hypothetical protein
MEDLTAQLRDRDDFFGSLQKSFHKQSFVLNGCGGTVEFKLPTMNSARETLSNNGLGEQMNSEESECSVRDSSEH